MGIIKNFKNKVGTMTIGSTFLVNYNLAIDDGKSKKDALRAGINFFRHRIPFNQLSDENVNKIVEIFIKLKDPTDVIYYLSFCEKKRSVEILKDTKELELKAVGSSLATEMKDMFNEIKKIKENRAELSPTEIFLKYLKSRIDWMFISGDRNSYVFRYKNTKISIRVSNENKDVIEIPKQIMYCELKENNPSFLSKWESKDDLFHFVLDLVKKIN